MLKVLLYPEKYQPQDPVKILCADYNYLKNY